MSYLQTVASVRAAAEAVNPTGRFLHGRRVDGSREFSGAYPLIFLYPIDTRDPSGPNEFMGTHTLLIGFWEEDKPDVNMLDQEALIGRMDALCTAFLNTLKLDTQLEVTSITREPQYKTWSATLSGYACRLSLQNFTPCVDE